MKMLRCVLSAAAITVVLAGCSVMNPHVRWDRLPENQPVSVKAGIDYANRAIDAYRTALAQHAYFHSGTGAAFIALTAAALGVGITGGGGDTIAILGLSGAGSYAIGSWLTNKPRGVVYTTGIQALSCAKEATLPYFIPPEEQTRLRESLNRLEDRLPALYRIRQQVALNIRTLKDLIDRMDQKTASGFEELTKAGKEIESAGELASSASAALARGNRLLLQLSRAGELLAATVDRIQGEVDKALLSTVSDLSALPGFISTIAQTYGMITAVPTPPAAVEAVRAEEKPREPLSGQVERTVDPMAVLQAAAELEKHLQEMVGIMAEISQHADKVRAVVDQFDEALPTAALKACGVSEELISPLRILPDAVVQLDKKDKVSSSRVIEGGSNRYLVRLLDEGVKDLLVSQPQPLGSIVRIEITDQTPVGTYNVLVKDVATDRNAFLQVQVK